MLGCLGIRMIQFASCHILATLPAVKLYLKTTSLITPGRGEYLTRSTCFPSRSTSVK